MTDREIHQQIATIISGLNEMAEPLKTSVSALQKIDKELEKMADAFGNMNRIILTVLGSMADLEKTVSRIHNELIENDQKVIEKLDT